MTLIAEWIRVSRANPCKVCEKPDWCTYSPALGLALCMRVESTKPSKNQMGGWLHRIGEPAMSAPIVRPHKTPPPLTGGKKLVSDWSKQTSQAALESFASSIGVDVASLVALRAAWAGQHRAWAFPMMDAYQEVIGIRLRAEDGRKWAVPGSRQGLFIPSYAPETTAYITEGPTDTAAALSIGLFAIGRPSCNCGSDHIRTFCRLNGVHRLVMVADNDKPGIEGAKKIATDVRLPYVIFIPPAKDLREFVQAGGNYPMVEETTKDLVWHTG